MHIHLKKDEFAIALKKGLGRALLHVIDHGLDDVADLVLNACIHDQNYDPQCESTRASWLFQMFNKSPQYSALRETILGKLEIETDPRDLLQLCELAKEMATHGDADARQRLRKRVYDKASSRSSDDWLGADLWIELEGVDGLLELARIYGQRLLLDADDWVPDDILLGNEKKQEIIETLRQYSKDEPKIKAYFDFLEARGSFNLSSASVDKEIAQHHERVRQNFSLESILCDARNKVGKYPGRYAQFGRHATANELKEIYDQLLNEPDEAVLVRLLWIFRRTPIPQFDERIIRWAEGPDNALRKASIATLAQISNDQVHALARSKVRNSKLLQADSGVLDLFLKNYESNDAHLITQTLASLKPDVDDAHSLGYSIVELSEQHRDTGLVNALKWVYENTPCTNCRYRIIKELSTLNQLDEELLYECCFDASEEIRNFAQRQRGIPKPMV